MPADSAVRLVLLLPDLLGTYGDAGNASVLARRLEWRGCQAELITVSYGQPVPAGGDLYLLGGGEDAAQELRHLGRQDGLRRAVLRGAPVLAVCAGLQVLGTAFPGSDGNPRTGLGLLDVETVRLKRRAVGEVVAEPVAPGLTEPLTGFENHLGGTTLGAAVRPLGTVSRGVGNGGAQHREGAVQGRIVGTYLHGPVLARNPQVADLLLGWATGGPLAPLPVEAVDRLRAQRLRPGRWRRMPARRRVLTRLSRRARR